MVFTGKKESDVGKGVNQEGTSRSDLTKVVQAKEEYGLTFLKAMVMTFYDFLHF